MQTKLNIVQSVRPVCANDNLRCATLSKKQFTQIAPPAESDLDHIDCTTSLGLKCLQDIQSFCLYSILNTNSTKTLTINYDRRNMGIGLQIP